MVRSWIATIYINKQAFVVKNNFGIHSIEFFAAIEPNPMFPAKVFESQLRSH
jgi:hypothetical protein